MLVDTNTILRTLQPRHPQFGVAANAILVLSRRGEELCITTQNLIELWAVATRPVNSLNGLGMDTGKSLGVIQHCKSMFRVLPDVDKIYETWEALVVKHRVSGKATHDARLVAAMHVHNQTSILTFNKADFVRYTDIQVVDPTEVGQGTMAP